MPSSSPLPTWLVYPDAPLECHICLRPDVSVEYVPAGRRPRMVVCADCLARWLEAETGFAVLRALHSWREMRKMGETIQARKHNQRKEMPRA